MWWVVKEKKTNLTNPSIYPFICPFLPPYILHLGLQVVCSTTWNQTLLLIEKLHDADLMLIVDTLKLNIFSLIMRIKIAENTPRSTSIPKEGSNFFSNIQPH